VGARYVATAHTADDQAETVLHRIFRGTGVAGLAGMARVRPLAEGITLIRPFLGVRRHELRLYLAALGQPFRCDRSNHDLRFTRNRLRRLLAELARDFNPRVVDALVRLGHLAGQSQRLVERTIADLDRRCVARQPGGTVRIGVRLLAGHPPYLVRELLLGVWRSQRWPRGAMGFAEWDVLAEMALAAAADPSATPRRRTLPGGILAELVADELRLRRLGSKL
jgi:tRNA(Ile)-lysidine synthase